MNLKDGIEKRRRRRMEITAWQELVKVFAADR